jgi:hypothetical protein
MNCTDVQLPSLSTGTRIPRPHVLDFDRLMMIACGHTAFQLCRCAVELGVFDRLAAQPGMEEGELARVTGLRSRPFRILLGGLLTLRLVHRLDGGLFNDAEVERMLVRDRPGNWVAAMGWQHHIVYPGEIDLLEALRQDRNCGLARFPGNEDNLYARLAHDPNLERVFQEAMSALSTGANHDLVAAVDFSGLRHLVDAGGGDGTNLMAICAANPGLRATVFDSPSVCARAQANLRTHGFSERIGVHPGDLFSTPFPTDMDAVLLAHLLSIWSPERDVALLRRVHAALPAGGRVVVFGMMANEDGIGPMSAALGSPYFLSIATGEGMLYRREEFTGFIIQAGFRVERSYQLANDHVALVGVKE